MAYIVTEKVQFTFYNAQSYEVEVLEELNRQQFSDLNKSTILTKAKEVASFNSKELQAIIAIHKIPSTTTGTPKIVKGERMRIEG